MSGSECTLSAQDWLHDAGLQQLLDILNRDNAVTRLVGGCVRDALLGREVTDVDLATTLHPGEVTARLEQAKIKAIPTGIAHGTVTAVMGQAHHEITTLRVDTETFGRHATVSFTNSWHGDAARRDFTINALYADADGKVHDFIGGLDDLHPPRIRFIGDPAERIREDALRILRFFRFVARIQDSETPLDPAAVMACQALGHKLDTLSGERIRQEMQKILLSPHPLPVLLVMQDIGLFPFLDLPQLSPERGQILAWYRAFADQPDWTTLLFLLCDGNIQPVIDHWRLGRTEARRLTLLCQEVPKPLATLEDRYLLLDRVPFDLFHDVLALQAAQQNENSPHTARALLEPVFAEALQSKDKPLPLTGHDLQERGIGPGPEMGQVLHRARDIWARSGFSLDKGQILERIFS